MTSAADRDLHVKGLTYILGTLFGIGLVVCAAMVSGVVTWQLWVWFAVPIGLPALTFAQALGLDCLVSWLISQDHIRPEQTWKHIAHRILLVPMVALLIGWLISHFV